MKGASLLARLLAAYDVKHVFGVPGETNVALYSALTELNAWRKAPWAEAAKADLRPAGRALGPATAAKIAS